eukprot:4981742-Amphidinium_carterae.1
MWFPDGCWNRLHHRNIVTSSCARCQMRGLSGPLWPHSNLSCSHIVVELTALVGILQASLEVQARVDANFTGTNRANLA